MKTNIFTSILRLALVLGFTFALMCAIAGGQVPNPAPSHWQWSGVAPAPVPISASAISDAFGNPIASAKLCFTPVDSTGKTTGFRVSQVQVMTKPVCGLVSNGVLQAGLSLAPTPTGIYYHPQVLDRATGNVLRDYCTTQITGGSWSLDSYDCATAPAPPPSSGSIAAAATADLAIYCGSNPTSALCGIPYEGLYDTGSFLTTAITSSGAPSVSCDAAHLFIKDYDLMNPGVEYTCLLVSGSYTWEQTAGGSSFTLTAAKVDALGTLSNDTTGTAAKATQLAATPTPCTSGYPTGVDAQGNAVGCSTPASGATTLPLSTTMLGSGMCHIADSTLSSTSSLSQGTTGLLRAAYNNQSCTGYEVLGSWYTNNAGNQNTGNGTCLDIFNVELFQHENPPDAGALDYYFQCGLGDYITWTHGIGWGTIGNNEAALVGANTAAVMWAGTPQHGKIAASNTGICTRSGTGIWSPFNPTLSGTATTAGMPLYGVGLTGTSGAVLNCSLPKSSNAVYLAWYVTDQGTDTASVTIDGIAAGTISSGAAGGISTNHSGSMIWGQRFPVTGSGAHTVLITVTAGNFAPMFMVAPSPNYNFYGLQYPNVYIGGIPPLSGSGNQYDAALNLDEATVAAQMKADGFHVEFADLRSGWPETYLPAGTPQLEYQDGTYPDGMTCTGAFGPHYNNCGATFNAWQFLKAAGKTPAPVQQYFGDGSSIAVQPMGKGFKVSATYNGVAQLAAANTFTNGQQRINTGNYLNPGLDIYGTAGAIVAPTYTGNQSFGAAPNYSCTTTATFTTTAGNALLIESDKNTIAPSDSNGDTFTKILDMGSPGGGFNSLWLATNIVGGSTTITWGSQFVCGYVELSGVATTNPVDATWWSGPVTVPTTPYTGGPIVTTSPNDLILAFVGNDQVGPPTGFTAIQNTGIWWSLGSEVAATPGSYSGVWGVWATSRTNADYGLIALRGKVSTAQATPIFRYYDASNVLRFYVDGAGNLHDTNCNSSNPLIRYDGTCGAAAGGLADPGAAGFVYRTTLNATAVGTLAQMIAAYWSDSSCSSNLYMKKDGTCGTPSGTFTDPLTTKGDFLTRSAAGDVRMPIGADGTSPIADSTQANGWRWGTVGSSAAFSPASIPDLLWWFEANRSNTSNGYAPGFINDPTHGFNAIEYTTGPTYATGAQNGQPAWTLNGTSAAGMVILPSGLTLGNQVTVFVVGKTTTSTNCRLIGGAANSLGLDFCTGTGALDFVKASVGQLAASTATINSGQWYTIDAEYDMVGGAYSFYVNGAAAGSGTAPASITGVTSSLFFNQASTNQYFSGQASAVLVFSRVLNSTELTNMRNLLRSIYATW